MSIVFENKDIRIDFFFVFDPKHESVSFLRPNGLWFKVFGVKTKKIKENGNTSLLENSLKNLYKIQQLAFISTPF